MNNRSDIDVDAQRETLAQVFDQDLDPLAKFETRFAEADVEPFEIFIEEILAPDDPHRSTLRQYQSTFNQWNVYMDKQGRHPTCPNETHVKGFISHLRGDPDDGGRGNSVETVKQKLYRLNKAYKYWQCEASFPHPHDYNPINTARKKVDLSVPEEKDLPRIGIDEMQEIMNGVTNYRSLAIIATQLKLGVRRGELCNIQLRDLHISNPELQRHYPNIGTHPKLGDYDDAIYIPPRTERRGNKSRRSRTLPLDDELRRVLLRYLLVRPDNGEPWLFLTLKTHREITDNATINDVWKATFCPKYSETKEHKAVTSHFGRHWFTTYWRVKQDVNDELVKYMRGDRVGGRSLDEQSAMDTYLHAYYEDIERLYRENIFKLNL